MKQIAIFPGSYNPVHIGHLALANYLCEYTEVDEIWMLVSPHNPLKEVKDLAPFEERMEMLRIAVAGDPKLKASDFECSLPQPSYTINTFRALTAAHPDTEFTLIIGGDNWSCFRSWQAWEEILANYRLIVYPRPGETIEGDFGERVQVVAAPQLEISSTLLRQAFQQGKALRHFLPHGVYDYIVDHKLYRNG